MLCTRLDSPAKIDLREIDPQSDGGLEKDDIGERQAKLNAEMEELFDLLFFAGQHSLLIVLQGMDTSGKDGTIRHLLQSCHAQSCAVASFKVPTPEELARDFLWRVHAQVPGRGDITIFNRSHYEDVLVVRVHELAPEAVWRKRYDHIRHFESLLAESRTIILKFFLHISKDEQEERLLAREQEVEKAWKLNAGDWKERRHWDAYQAAYEDAIGKTAAPDAPWHVVPANRKWYRNLAISEAIVQALRPYRDEWMAHLTALGEKAKAELAAMRNATSA